MVAPAWLAPLAPLPAAVPMLAVHLGEPLGPELLRITVLTIVVSGIGTILGALVGVPLGTWMALHPSSVTRTTRMVTRTLYGMPPVVVGLIVFTMLSRNGPLGEWGLLFTVEAMVMAQFLLVTPLILGLSMGAVEAVDPALRETARSLGARGWMLVATFLREAREGVLSAVLVGFGRAISEVGAVLIVGGNILFHTRLLTTAIVEETEVGNLEFALALGVVLVAMALTTTLLVGRLEDRRGDGPVA